MKCWHVKYGNFIFICWTYDELSYWENKIKVTGRSIPYYLVFIKSVRGGRGLSVGVKIFSYIKYLCKKLRRN